MKKKILYIFIIIIISQGLGSRIALGAIDSYKLIEPIPCIDGTGNGCENGLINNVNVDTYIAYIFKIAIALAGFLAVVMIIYGGFTYMLSESITSKSGAKDTIKNVVLGLLGALSSFLILQTIDPRLVNINTTIPKIQVKDDSSVDRFANQLSSDMKQMSAETRDQVAKMKDESDKLKQQIDSLKKEISDNPSNKSDLENQLYELENQWKKAEANVAKTSAISIGTTYFRNAFDTITKENAGEDLVDTNSVDKHKIDLQKAMDLYKDKANNIGEYNTSQDITNIENYYLDQIDNERMFVDSIVNGYTKVANRVSINYSVRKQLIEDFLKKYENPETDPYYQKYKLYPNNEFILDSYKKLQDSRASRAKEVLKKI